MNHVDPLENFDKFVIPDRPLIEVPITSLVLETRPEMFPRIHKIFNWHRKFFKFQHEVVVSNVDPCIPGVTFVNCGNPPPQEYFMMWYSDFCVHGLNQLCDSSHLLLWQADGFIINPQNWTDLFLQWDYVGAPERGVWYDVAVWMQGLWPDWKNPFDKSHCVVGNGGFSLRTKKFLEATASLSRTGLTVKAEDMYLCIERRQELEDMGLFFCPPSLGELFARDWGSTEPIDSAFGFHGYENLSQAKKYLEYKYLPTT